jgi:hypothetical protein
MSPSELTDLPSGLFLLRINSDIINHYKLIGFLGRGIDPGFCLMQIENGKVALANARLVFTSMNASGVL